MFRYSAELEGEVQLRRMRRQRDTRRRPQGFDSSWVCRVQEYGGRSSFFSRQLEETWKAFDVISEGGDTPSQSRTYLGK